VPIDALVRLWTERALAQDPQLGAPSNEPGVALSRGQFSDAVRQALRDLHRPELLARNPLLRSRFVQARATGEQERRLVLERVLWEAAQTLRRHPRDDKLWRAVHRTYLRPAGTQEAAAEVLGVPFSTYRRHLSHGVQRIDQWLWDQDLYDHPGDPGEQS
jgi:hypothetical protein